jgi:hypothetical protein
LVGGDEGPKLAPDDDGDYFCLVGILQEKQVCDLLWEESEQGCLRSVWLVIEREEHVRVPFGVLQEGLFLFEEYSSNRLL